MNLFISWSGEESRELAQTFRTWIPSVIQAVQPYFTPSDIEKGARWNAEISKELDDSDFGLLFLNRDNLEKPWLMFEAGALSKSVDDANLCPILFGVENTDLKGPLTHFQAANFKKNEIKSLIVTINSKCGEARLSDEVLNDVFEMWWPRLEHDVEKIVARNNEHRDESGDESVRTDRDLLEEVLVLSRISATSLRSKGGQNRGRLSREAVRELGESFLIFIRSNSGNFDEDTHYERLKVIINYVLKRNGVEDEISRSLAEQIEEFEFSSKTSSSDLDDEIPF